MKFSIRLAIALLLPLTGAGWAAVGDEAWMKEISDKNQAALDAQFKALDEAAKAQANRFKFVSRGGSYGCVNAQGKRGLNSMPAVRYGLMPRDFECMDLNGVDLSHRSFRNSSFAGSSLRGAVLRRTDLSGADLRGTDLRGIDFYGITLVRINPMEGEVAAADLRGADLRGCDFSSVDTKLFKELSWTGAKYDDTSVFVPRVEGAAAAIKAQTGMDLDQLLVHLYGMVKLDGEGKPIAIEKPAAHPSTPHSHAGHRGRGVEINPAKARECVENISKKYPGSLGFDGGNLMVRDLSVYEELMKCLGEGGGSSPGLLH